MRYLIFLVEDDQNLNRALAAYLENEGWLVKTFSDAESAWLEKANNPHLWIMDVMLPGMDGYHLLNKIKGDNAEVPVILISARGGGLDRIAGLELGGDDYLTKPFLAHELVIRCRKILRRVYENDKAAESTNRFLLIHSYRIEFDTRRVFQNGRYLRLTPKEFEVLSFLVLQRGKVVTREQLMVHIWNDKPSGGERTVDTIIRRLRLKLPELGLETCYGYGYRISSP